MGRRNLAIAKDCASAAQTRGHLQQLRDFEI